MCVHARAADTCKQHTSRCCTFLTRDSVLTAELCIFTAKAFIPERCLPRPPGVTDRLLEQGVGCQTAGSARPRPACLPSPAPSYETCWRCLSPCLSESRSCLKDLVQRSGKLAAPARDACAWGAAQIHSCLTKTHCKSSVLLFSARLENHLG